jgi:hypothetical protein
MFLRAEAIRLSTESMGEAPADGAGNFAIDGFEVRLQLHAFGGSCRFFHDLKLGSDSHRNKVDITRAAR